MQSLYFLNPKFQGSSHLLLQYSLVCVGPGRKPRRPVFSQRGSYEPCQERMFSTRLDLNRPDPELPRPRYFGNRTWNLFYLENDGTQIRQHKFLYRLYSVTPLQKCPPPDFRSLFMQYLTGWLALGTRQVFFAMGLILLSIFPINKE